MSDKQLAVSNTESVIGSFTQKELDTLKSTIAKGTTNEQFALFIQTCVNSGLNPFLNQIYCIVYDGQKGPVMSMQIAVEGIVALAKKHPQYKGFIASEVKETDEFEIDMVTGEPIHKIKGLGNRGKTLGAFCVAYREGMPNISVVVDLDQVSHLINSSVANTKKMWADYRDDMLVKHAIKRAFKRQFGIEVAEDESITSSDSIPEYKPTERRDITSEASHTEPPKKLEPEAEKVDPKVAARAAIKVKLAQLDLTTVPAIDGFFQANKVKYNDPKNPTLTELQGVIKLLDMKIADKQAEDEAPLTVED